MVWTTSDLRSGDDDDDDDYYDCCDAFDADCDDYSLFVLV